MKNNKKLNFEHSIKKTKIFYLTYSLAHSVRQSPSVTPERTYGKQHLYMHARSDVSLNWTWNEKQQKNNLIVNAQFNKQKYSSWHIHMHTRYANPHLSLLREHIGNNTFTCMQWSDDRLNRTKFEIIVVVIVVTVISSWEIYDDD